jgi:hypothetical protein
LEPPQPAHFEPTLELQLEQRYAVLDCDALLQTIQGPEHFEHVCAV